MPPVINGLRGGHTNANIPTREPKQFQETKARTAGLKNCDWICKNVCCMHNYKYLKFFMFL